MVNAETYPMLILNTLFILKLSFEKKKKNIYCPLNNFRLLCYLGMQYCHKALLSNFCSILCQMVDYVRLNTIIDSKLFALKVVAVAYE